MSEDSGPEETSYGTAPSREIATGIYRLSHAISKSIRYHAKRRRFFDNLHYAVNAIIAVGGSGAFVALWSGDKGNIALYIAGIVAVASSLDLVFGFFKRGHIHDDLLKRFSRLLHDITLMPHTLENLAKWCAERLLIEEEEPTFLALLVAICENEVFYAEGHYGEVLEGIGPCRRVLAHWISFDGYFERLLKAYYEKKAVAP